MLSTRLFILKSFLLTDILSVWAYIELPIHADVKKIIRNLFIVSISIVTCASKNRPDICASFPTNGLRRIQHRCRDSYVCQVWHGIHRSSSSGSRHDRWLCSIVLEPVQTGAAIYLPDCRRCLWPPAGKGNRTCHLVPHQGHHVTETLHVVVEAFHLVDVVNGEHVRGLG